VIISVEEVLEGELVLVVLSAKELVDDEVVSDSTEVLRVLEGSSDEFVLVTPDELVEGSLGIGGADVSEKIVDEVAEVE